MLGAGSASTAATAASVAPASTASATAPAKPRAKLSYKEQRELDALMHAVRVILRRNDAFAVVATHSPVVVQETLSRHVSIVRRSGDEICIFRPQIQTYGESIGEITNEVFGLTADATDFHSALSSLVEKGLTLELIERLFDGGLSMQARAFVMTKLATREAG